jgi:acyltransferase-like protein
MRRDPYLDALRAASLLVVVFFHWFGTILHWSPTGPHATSPLASVPGLWLGTWLLQVMPVFFYVGGCLHRRAHRPGYVRGRLVGLLSATAPLLLGWAVVGAVLTVAGGARWARGVVLLALSPLWFLVVYLLLVALLPVAIRLHRRLGAGALPLLVAVAAVVDGLRLGLGLPWVGWLNLAVVWGLAHQAGFHHERLMTLPRRWGYGLVAAGLLGLCGLLALGYPGSMVGVPGQKWSNMSPPTLAIVALTTLQVGLIRLAYPAVPRLLERAAARRALAIANRYGMPVFLFHLTTFLLAQAVGWPIALAALAVLLRTGSPQRPPRRRVAVP